MTSDDHPWRSAPDDLTVWATVGRDQDIAWLHRGRRGGPLGNALITLAGADKTVLTTWSADRAYFVGLGGSLLLSSLIASVSVTAAVSIAFGVPMDSWPLILLGVAWYGLFILFDRWLVSGDQTAGFARPEGGLARAVSAWIGHFFVELFRISPRLVLAGLSSLLFANFIALAVFNPEIQQELTRMNSQQVQQWNQWVSADEKSIVAQAKSVISEATTEENSVQQKYSREQGNIAAAYTSEQKAITQANRAGLYCTEEPYYNLATNANGSTYQTLGGYSQVCPPQIVTAEDNYATVVKNNPMTPAQVTSAQNAIASRLNVAGAQANIKNAQSSATSQMTPYYPKRADGIMARMQALQLLTVPPASPCPNPPTVNDLARNPACTANYSTQGSTIHTELRWWLLLLEVAPVLFKFFNSVLPRRGYAWTMADRDAELRLEAQSRMDQFRLLRDTDVAAARRKEHARLEEEGALQEYKERELARQERRLGLRRIRARFAATAADTRRVLDGRRRHPDQAARRENVIPFEARVDPRNTQADSGLRVIDSEDFLLS